MNTNGLIKVLCVKLVVILSFMALQGCSSITANKVADNTPYEKINTGYIKKVVPAIMIDGVPYHKEKVEELITLWNDMSKKTIQIYNNKFDIEFNAYMVFLENLPVIPAPEMIENNEFQMRFLLLKEELVINLSFAKIRIRDELEKCAVDKKYSYNINGAYAFDDLFQGVQVVTIDDNMCPAFVFNRIQESMGKMSEKEQLHLLDKLEKTFTTLYSIRKNNSKEFAHWVNGWGNYFTKSFKDLTGSWSKEYMIQYNKYINNGVDTDLPKKIVIDAKNRAEIILYGYIKVLEHSLIDDKSSDVVMVIQKTDYADFFTPFTLLQYVIYAGEIAEIDTSSWHQEANDRIGGGLNMAFHIIDIVFLVATKFHPFSLVTECVVRAGGVLWYIGTKKGKNAKLEEELKASLDDELNQILLVLREPLNNGVLLAQSDA